MKVAVTYWTASGNTEAMADALVAALKEKGAEADKIYVSDAPSDLSEKYDAFAFGCPAMGDEVLEEGEFDPTFTGLEASLKDKKVVLFGSYGWGDGKWMRDWQERCINDGMKLLADGVICMGEPQDDTVAALGALADTLLQ